MINVIIICKKNMITLGFFFLSLDSATPPREDYVQSAGNSIFLFGLITIKTTLIDDKTIIIFNFLFHY